LDGRFNVSLERLCSMTTVLVYVRRFLKVLTKTSLLRILTLTVLITIIGTTSIYLLEKSHNQGIKTLADALWWTIVTITTVGYGDIYPATLAGRIIAIFLMLIGIGVIGMFTATIATLFVDEKIKEERGLKEFTGKKHTIICGWNERTREIIKEIRSNDAIKETSVVVIANIDTKPLDDENVHFVRGEVNENTLKQANLAQASSIIILINDDCEYPLQDAQAVLNTLTVESLNPDVYTCVEINDVCNVKHCERAHADEIVVRSDFSTKLLARSSVHHGISKFIAELLSSQYGTELLKVKAGRSHIGKKFLDVFSEVKKKFDATILAVQSEDALKFSSNPSSDYIIKEGDYFIIVAKKMPDFE
jgi:voltage-gated potassium channel